VRPQTVDPAIRSEFIDRFQGIAPRIRFCDWCTGTITIDIVGDDKPPKLSLRGVDGILLVGLAVWNEELDGLARQFARRSMDIRGRLANRFLDFNGVEFDRSSNVSALQICLSFAFLLGGLAMLGVWSHQRVLLYLKSNSVLVPLAASQGPDALYSALWLLTLVRLAAFFVTGAILSWLSFKTVFSTPPLSLLFSGDVAAAIAWGILLVIGFCVPAFTMAAMEFKVRQSSFAWAVKYIVVLTILIGGVIHGSLFFSEAPIPVFLRQWLYAVPFVGIPGLALAPVVRPDWWFLVLHGAGSAVLLCWMWRTNRDWFRRNLEVI
jgi:hypothetical protein